MATERITDTPNLLITPAIPEINSVPQIPENLNQFEYSLWIFSHWDREWYIPVDRMKARAGNNLTNLVVIMEQDPEYQATLDGQAISLEDFYSTRPEMEKRMESLIREGRVEVGPFYVLPDSFKTPELAHIHNSLIGKKMAREFGAEPMPVWHAPDTFGHFRQVPQIASGFGFKAVTLWRGLSEEQSEKAGAVFNWRAGRHTVPVIRLLDGYGAADRIGLWDVNALEENHDPTTYIDRAVGQLSRFVDRYEDKYRHANTKNILMGVGTDHREFPPEIPQVLKALREKANINIKLVSLGKYAQSTAKRKNLTELSDTEFVSGHEVGALRGINSVRPHQTSIPTHRAENELYNAQAIAALSHLYGKKNTECKSNYPYNDLQTAWKAFLRTQPHDTVGGCSVDQVHSGAMREYTTVSEITEHVLRKSEYAMSELPLVYSYERRANQEYSVINQLAFERQSLVYLRVPEELAGKVKGVESNGNIFPVQIVEQDGKEYAIACLNVDSYSSAPIKLLSEDREPTQSTVEKLSDTEIQNTYMKLAVQKDGTLTATDRLTGKVYENLLWFEDVGDRGDEYNFDPAFFDSPLDSRRMGEVSVKIVEEGPVRFTLEVTRVLPLPKGLDEQHSKRSEETSESKITYRVSLISGINRAEIDVKVNNSSKNHRLRAMFDVADWDGSEVRAKEHFIVEHRSPLPVQGGNDWMEPLPVGTQHNLGAVSMGDLVVFNRGLQEYEGLVTPAGGTLAMTLFRSVGDLSRADLTSRLEHAGPPLKTPEAQMLGEHNFSLGITFSPKLSDAGIARANQDYQLGFEVAPKGVKLSNELTVEGEGIYVCELKAAEQGTWDENDREKSEDSKKRGLIVRVCNPDPFKEATCRVSGSAVNSVHLSRMDEEIIHPISTPFMTLPPGEIVTLYVV